MAEFTITPSVIRRQQLRKKFVFKNTPKERAETHLKRARVRSLISSEIADGKGNKGDINDYDNIPSTIAWDMYQKAILYSPSLVGKNFYWHSALLDQSSRRKDVDGYDSDSDSDDDSPFLGEDRDKGPNTLSKAVTHGDLILYALKNPISFIWKLAWPTQDQIFRGLGDIVFPLRFAHILFYGLTTCFEAGLKGLAALLLRPFNNALIGKNRLIGFTIGIPLGLIGQVAMFFANALEHARFVGDALFNIIPSLINSFLNNDKDRFPTLGACFGSFFRNLPFLILDAIVIAACFVPGGQLFTFLGSLGNTVAASAFSSFMAHIVIPIGKFLGTSFFAPLANNFILAGMSEYGSSSHF